MSMLQRPPKKAGPYQRGPENRRRAWTAVYKMYYTTDKCKPSKERLP
jgi:hypothetical protein